MGIAHPVANAAARINREPTVALVRVDELAPAGA
jgi:hypothetical protein